MKLPNGDRADLGSKLEDYVLNPLHWDGQHKARVFESVLGITLSNRDELKNAILTAVANMDTVEPRGDNGHGDVFVLRFSMQTSRGNAVILTAWIVRHGEDFPRLVTCYIL
jgi:hypothetical protein